MRPGTVLLLTGLMITARTAAAQSYAMDKGVWLAGGNAALTHLNGCCGAPGATSIVVNPTLGYFVAPGIAVTGNLQLIHSFTKGSPSVTTVGAGPGLAWYFIKGPSVIHPYLAGNVLFQHSGTSGSSSSSSAFTWTGSGGIAALLARNVALTGDLYYSHQHFSSSGGGSSASASASQYGSRFGFALFLY
jgi:hypothetical protein